MIRNALKCTTLLAACALPVSAQMPRADVGAIGLRAIGLVTEARPAILEDSRREYYITQPVLTLHHPGEHLDIQTMLNFEAWTLEDGELNAGIWGEGFVDKRHPHTFLHEMIFTAHDDLGGFRLSLTGGRGFAPFGSDDPMVRPFVKYPSNHHLAQILERWVVIGGIGLGDAFVLEAGVFNGDEPTGPRSRGKYSRLGDSRAGRVTLRPFSAAELSVSRALVESPEHVDGGGLDQRKWHASGRLGFQMGTTGVYGLIEWARTDEFTQAEAEAFTFESRLAEAAVDVGSLRAALRWERSERPEEERLEDPFRTVRPHAGDEVLGVTRWRSLTLHLAATAAEADAKLSPFVEVSRLTVEEITGGVFDPGTFYGSGPQWSFSLGLKLSAGVQHMRAGRYGAALSAVEGPMIHR